MSLISLTVVTDKSGTSMHGAIDRSVVAAMSSWAEGQLSNQLFCLKGKWLLIYCANREDMIKGSVWHRRISWRVRQNCLLYQNRATKVCLCRPRENTPCIHVHKEAGNGARPKCIRCQIDSGMVDRVKKPEARQRCKGVHLAATV